MSHSRTALLSALFALSTALGAAELPSWQRFTARYKPRQAAQPVLANSPRVVSLTRAGSLYLTLDDAIQLAIENNLDVEIQRNNLALAETELARTRGGGLPRGIAYTLSEMPSGVGGPTSQLLTSASRVIPGTSVSTNPFEVGALGVIQTNLSITGALPLSNGTAVPNFDPYLSSHWNYYHTSAPQLSVNSYGVPNLVTDNNTAGAGFRQGFASGAAFSASFENLRQTLNSVKSAYSPYTTSYLGASVTQPLLRGFGVKLNRRFQRIAENERRIVDLLFRQQLINTVYGTTRLYHDFVALYEDVKVKQDTAALAQKLFDDTKAQVEEGTLASVELARANAQVFSTRLDLQRARGVLEEQEAILKNVLTRRGVADEAVRLAHIVPMGTLNVPVEEQRKPEALYELALANRPDLAQAGLQIANSELTLQGSVNNLKPQLDISAYAQNYGMAGETSPAIATPEAVFLGGYGSALAQIFRRNYPVYGAGIQLDLPLKNRVAQADLARDQIQLRQTRIREHQLQNQARLEVEDALIALRRAKSSYEAASEARAFQEESFKAEQAKFEVGASTSYLVIQFQNFLAQARSTEVAARSAYIKARGALQRATASILSDYNVSVDAAR